MTRTLLLTLHIAAVTGWLGADLLIHAVTPRMAREPAVAATSWTRQQAWLHERYYPAVVAVVLLSGVLLVLDGDWSWSSGFIWVGVAAIVGGATLGGGVLGSLAKRQLAAQEAGDQVAAGALARRGVPVGLLVTAFPVVAILAMVDKWAA